MERTLDMLKHQKDRYEKSFGLVFGPSKSGKTIFCENLAMSIAMGKTDFFGYKLDGIPKKEYWIQMQLQMEVCDLDECDFLETRFIE